MKALSGESYWRDPEEEPPPLGMKVLLLTPGNVCVTGTWTDWAVAWAPLPKVPPEIKRKLEIRYEKN